MCSDRQVEWRYNPFGKSRFVPPCQQALVDLRDSNLGVALAHLE